MDLYRRYIEVKDRYIDLHLQIGGEKPQKVI